MFEVAKKTIMPYKTVNNLISFTAMWYKINELSRKNLTQVQIAALLDVNRSTVRRYQMIREFGIRLVCKQLQLPCLFHMHRQCLWFVVKEAVGSESRA